MRKIGLGLLAVATVGHALTYLVAAPAHVVDATWPPHARFHVLQALIWAVGFDLVILAIVGGPLRRRDLWAWWTSFVAWPFVHGAYFLAFAIGGQPPGVLPHVVLGALLVAYGIGLGLTRPRGTAS